MDLIRFPEGDWLIVVDLDLVFTGDVVNTPRFVLFDAPGGSIVESFPLDTLTSGSGIITVPPGNTYYGRPDWFFATPESGIRLAEGSTITVTGPCQEGST